MLSTSSHDTKRGEDVRARIATLSGHAADWDEKVDVWTAMLTEQGAPEIDRGDIYYFFQTLLGAWPAHLAPGELNTEALVAFRDRLSAAMLKSIREARQRTNWNVPRTDYEDNVAAFVRVALSGETDNFLQDFRGFEQELAWQAACNGLIETTIKLTAPGVPDIYQGAELWEQSMVDPDNRRAVDFAAREEFLAGAVQETIDSLAEHFRDGSVKLALITRLLKLRRSHPALFAEGDYQPVIIGGADGKRVLAFMRSHGGTTLLVSVAAWPWRGSAPVVPVPDCPATGTEWKDALHERSAADVLFHGEIPISILIAIAR